MKKIVGSVGVDAGILHVGDPCYVLRDVRKIGAPGSRVEVESAALDHIIALARQVDSTQVDDLLESSRKIIEHEDRFNNKPGANYSDMIDNLHNERDSLAPEGYQGVWAPYRHDMEGITCHPDYGPHIGIVTSTGWGDGMYPVEVEWVDKKDDDEMWGDGGRVKSITVHFLGDEEGDDDDEDTDDD